jgi:hypothetical protein
VSGFEDITYALDFPARGPGHRENKLSSFNSQGSNCERAGQAIPRIARLMALAIRFDRLLRAEEFRDYAELARLGRVTRGRMTQIMKLLDLAPDIQEQLLFLPIRRGLNERNLRPVVSRINWNEQRSMFEKILHRCTGLATRPEMQHDLLYGVGRKPTLLPAILQEDLARREAVLLTLQLQFSATRLGVGPFLLGHRTAHLG